VPKLHHNSSKTLTHRTLIGLNWRFSTTFVQNILTFIVGIVLAREEFGLLGIAIIFIGFSELFATLGMGAAVIQRRSLTDTHLRVAITFSILLGLIIICVLWILSYPIARFFNNPSVTLILMIISLSFLPKGISAPCRGLLRRKLQFKALFFIELTSYLLGA